MEQCEAALYWTHRSFGGVDSLETLFIRGHMDPAEFVGRAYSATKDVAETLRDAAAIAALAPEDVRHGYGRWLYQHAGEDDVVLPALPDGGPPEVPDSAGLVFEMCPDAADPAAFPITAVEVSYDDLPAMH